MRGQGNVVKSSQGFKGIKVGDSCFWIYSEVFCKVDFLS